MSKKSIIFSLFVFLAFVSFNSSVIYADVPTVVTYSASPSAFGLGQASSTLLCMTDQISTALTFDNNDISKFTVDQTIGNVTSVDSTAIVNSSTLVSSDFSINLVTSVSPPESRVKITYTNPSSKAFNKGDSVCVKVNFTANAVPTAALVRFVNKFTGAADPQPSAIISIIDPAMFPVSGGGGGMFSSVNALPGTAAGSIFVDRNTGNNTGNNLTIQGGASAAGSTDIMGGDLLLGGGIGTGLGGGGNVRIQTAPRNGISGTSDNLLVDREIIVSKAKQLTLSAPGFTSLMSIKLTGTQTAGGRIFYTIRATDGGSQIATESGVIQYLATANSITCTVQATDKLHLGTVNSGCTPGFFNPGSQPGVSIFDNVTFSSSAPIVVHEIYFRITNESGSPIRLEP